MSRFKRDNKAIDKDAGYSAKVIRTPGVYDATIVRAAYKTSTNGAGEVQFTLKFDEPAVEQTFYNLYIYKADGTENGYGYPKWSSLLYILGIDDPGEPVDTKVELPSKGGGKEAKTLAIFPKLAGRKVKVNLKVTYRRHEGEIKERVTIERFYRASDGASGRELIKGTPIGEQLIEDKARNVSPIYENGLTASVVTAWLSDFVKSKDDSTPASKPKSKFSRKEVEEPEDETQIEDAPFYA